jgi:non-canonical (house-cleaning) NTP pyrophosphatase
MKILKPGREQNGYAVELKCTGKGNGGGGCGAELLVEKDDLFRTERSCMGKEIDYYTTFQCPSCKVLTDIQNPFPPFNSQDLPHFSTWEKKNRMIPKTPQTFFIAGSSKIKLNALQAAVTSTQNCYATVTPIEGAESLINEQPVGFRETLAGAINRTLTAEGIDPRADIYFSAENGIEYAEKDGLEAGGYHTGSWTDFAIVLARIKTGENRGHIFHVKSESVVFPTEAVESTRQKQGGFAQNTVGKTLQEMGLVKNHADPHADLAGKSRQQILQEAFEELLAMLPSS